MSGVRDYPAFYVVTVNLFEVLESDIDEFSSVGAVYVAGDLNGRVGLKPAYISFDANINGLNSADYKPDVPPCRASDDQTLNTQGVQILELCKSTGLRICNGRYYNCKSGAFNFVGNNGCSVIDYLLTRVCDFDRLTLFGIMEINEFSDHAPLQFAFKTYSDLNTNIEHAREATFIRWDNIKAAEFKRQLI